MKDLELIGKALEKANQRGVFSLEESAVIFNAMQCLQRDVDKLQQTVTSIENNKAAVKEAPDGKPVSKK